MSQSAPHIHTETRRIVMSEVDVSQIHFTMAYAWMDRGLCEWLAEMGWPFTRLLEEGAGIPIVNSQCRFDQRMVLDDLITHLGDTAIGDTEIKSLKQINLA